MKSSYAKYLFKKTEDDYNRIAQAFSNKRSYLTPDLLEYKKFVKSGDRVLDFGCGNGRVSEIMKSETSYVGVDSSKELIKIAKTKYPEASFIVGDMRKLPFGSAQGEAGFDTVFCIAAFHHLATAEDRLQALREMKRVLRSRGKIILVNWNLLGKWGIGKVEKGDFKRFGNDFSVPWRNSDRKILGERFYHAFTLDEIELLCKGAYLHIEQNLYSKKGIESDKENGENIVTVITSQ